MRDVADIALRLGLEPVLVGSNLATEQSPPAGAKVRHGARITVQFGTPSKRNRSLARESGIRMRTGLSQLEDTSNSKTNPPMNAGKIHRNPASLARSMKLRDLLQGVEANIPASAQELEIRQVACDSRKVKPRALFFALHGAKADGNTFIRDAVSRGAAAIASEEAAASGYSLERGHGFKCARRAKPSPLRQPTFSGIPRPHCSLLRSPARTGKPPPRR